MGYNKTFRGLEDIHTGYVLEMNSSSRLLVARIRNFEKVGVRIVQDRPYGGKVLSECFDNELKGVGPNSGLSIDKVYGLSNSFNSVFSTDVAGRPLLWERKVVKKMTVAEVSEALGYEVEIVKEKTDSLAGLF